MGADTKPIAGARCWRVPWVDNGGRRAARRVALMADGLLEAVRRLWLADPEPGPKPLLAKLREQQPDLGAGTKEVREALRRPPSPHRLLPIRAARLLAWL